MHNIKYMLLAAVLMLAVVQKMAAQSSPNCATASDNDYYKSTSFFNYGNVSNAYTTKTRLNVTVGQPVVGSYFAQQTKGTFGFWSSFLMPPAAPVVIASEGDLEDRVQIDWAPDPLSPTATSYKLYRNGSLLAAVDGETFSFLDFNVIAGKFYTYEVTGVNTFGEGVRGSALGFLNPNGVVTGQVKSLAGNPVPGTIVTLTPTIGTSGIFAGDDMAFAEYNTAYPRTQFTLSTWVKLGAGNDNAAIFDLGSTISKNWWLHTLPAASGKGVRFGMGNGVGNVTEMDYAFPAATANDWHNIAVTYNGSSLLLYADGELISTAVAQVSADSMPLFFGQKANGTDFYKGNIDEVRFFDRQLSQTEIQMFLNRTVAPDMAGLVNYWKFDEGTGSKTFDLTAAKQKLYFCGAAFSTDKPNVLNAGLTNEDGFYRIPGINYAAGTTFTARPSKNFYYNQSLEFNGVNEQFATLTDFDLADSSSIEITVKGFDFAGDQCLLNKGSHFNLNLNAGALVLTIGGTTHNLGTLSMGFHRLSFVIEQVGGGSSAVVTFYKDGALVGTNTFSGVAANFAGGGGWLLGKNAGGNYFSGLIDELAFYNTLLSLPDIQLAANVGTNVTNKNLINYFPLNEGEGTSLVDYGLALSGKGTISGATFSTVAGIMQEEPHKFTPSTRFVTLDPSNTSVDVIDFFDQSTVPVSGYVRFDGTDCFQEGVEIYKNGQRASPPVFTDSLGYFSIDLEPGETAQLSPVFKNHYYYPGFWELDNIASPVAGILFRNQVKRHIKGQLAGNEICRKSIIPTDANGNVTAIVKVKVETLDGCYYKDYQFDNPNGKFSFDNLPPLPFTVAVTEHSNNVIYNFFQLRGGTTLDLTEKNDTTDFIYYAPPEIEMTAFDTNSCGQPMLEQDSKYSLDVRVFQDYDGGRCYLDTAKLHFENLIEGTELDTLMTTGRIKYKFKAGFPNIAPPYLQSLTVEAEANDQLNTYAQSAVVLGERPRQVNFTSTTPDIPLMILRDPPGDASSTTLEKGKTVCNGWSFGTTNTIAQSRGIEVNVGNKTQFIAGTPVSGTITETGFDDILELGVTMTIADAVNESAEICITATETISTSDGDVIVGEDADVYVGGALNLLFGITDKLVWDTANCAFVIDTGLLVFPDKFATTFLYSGHQIKTVTIPALELLGDMASANAWRAILQRNADLKKRAFFEKNLSFDAGVAYSNSSTTENTETESFGFNVDLNASTSAALGFEIAGAGSTFTLGMELTFGTSNEFSKSTTNTQTITYSLGDDDIGDNFTVDVLQDRVYGTPVFKTVSGNSSCPYEVNTVPREEVEIAVDKTIAVNVPENDAATFKFTLGNISQTEDTREYLFSLIPESNPLGAVVKIQGGSPLDRPFQVPYGASQEVIVTIERGPIDYDYEDLEFAWFSACEDEKGIALGQTSLDPKFYKSILLDVNFVEPCSPIDLGFPLQNWVWTIASGDSMFITLNKFNRFDADLELIRVQYRRKYGDGAWINIAEVPKAQLDNDLFKIVKWGTQALQDGEYEIRAVTQCFSGQDAGISHVISGRFERQSPVLFGTPEPADGILSRGDEISIRFNEPIRCDQLIQADFFNNNNVGLYDAETGSLIDAIISCQGDKIIIIPNVPNRFIENKVLRVEVNNIKDLANNVFVETSWEFFADRNPIRWEGGNIKVSKGKSDEVVVIRKIVNDGGQAADYDLKGIPTWARVFPTNGTLLPGALTDITFVFDSNMVFGNYLDTVQLDAPEGIEPLIVNCRVLCESPDWEFSPAAYPHTMNFSLKLDIEGALSTDEEDIVAAFIDGELRGTARVQLLPTLPPLGTQYMAFLTVYGDSDDDGKPVKLEIWDASACLRYGEVIEQFDFEVDNVIGTIGTPTVLHTNSMVRRDIPLTTGWNWISFNLLHPDPSLNASLASLKYPANDLIKGQSSFSEYFGGNWIGSLAALNNRNMFQFRADQPDTIQMRGALIDPASLSIPISAGWNWVGYVPNYALTVSQALAGLTPLNGDIIKGQTSFAQYIAGFGWLGSLQFMEPPKGYQLKISLPGTLTYPPQPQNKPAFGKPTAGEPAISLLKAGEPSAAPHPSLLTPRSLFWSVDAAQFEHSMTLVGMLSAGGQNTTLTGHEIGAFAGGQLRGSAQAIYIEPLDTYAFFLTTFANTSGEQLQFKLYDSTTGQVQDLVEKMYFVADLHQGSVQSPVPFTLKTSGLADIKSVQYLEVQPNPFEDATMILFAADHAQEVRLLISDATGRTVLSQKIAAAQGLNQFRWEAKSSASAGVYFVRLETGEGTAVRKVVKE